MNLTREKDVGIIPKVYITLVYSFSKGIRAWSGKNEVSNFKSKIVLMNEEASMNPTAEELAKIVLTRIGLVPRKRGATDKMHQTFLELYERAKGAYREKKPERAVMTVEEMGLFAGISRQTMYDYLGRWLTLGLIMKTSYIHEGKVIVGYKLAGNTLEQAFEKAQLQVEKHLNQTQEYIAELQKLIKNEKISMTQKMRQVEQVPEQELRPEK